ncbi:hypothetical protein L3Q82_022772 [Scortum barcoo]|uniref:Uncharacterized protein n=1 Tax=Scortum barcoo TaxID=214431 RepID=A0ACB8WWR6_9TELE|nr:hypothetical protein L3Q82_022772 [Scortum barcoo]
MAVLMATLCAVFMVTVVLSKPVCLTEGEDSSETSESSELNSSEETHVGSSQDPLDPALTETHLPNTVEETDSPDTAAQLPSADAGTSPAILDTSAPPGLEDPQTSTDADALQLMPDDPSQTALGIEVSQDMPDSAPAQDSIHTDTAHIPPDTEVSLHSRAHTNRYNQRYWGHRPTASHHQHHISRIPPGCHSTLSSTHH